MRRLICLAALIFALATQSGCICVLGNTSSRPCGQCKCHKKAPASECDVDTRLEIEVEKKTVSESAE